MSDEREWILCQPRELPPDPKATEEELALVLPKWWGKAGKRFTVDFLDSPPPSLVARLLEHMNAWSVTANVSFVASKVDPLVRVTRTPGSGHWSYVGTDVARIPKHEPTMNLDSFTMDTPESEFHRVVRHEAGHTLGFPHEHMRRELVAKIDRAKAYAFFGATQGWTEQMVDRQVLTALEDHSLLGTPRADPTSIMCYHVPGSITVDGKPIPGGDDINVEDFGFAGKVYPKSKA